MADLRIERFRPGTAARTVSGEAPDTTANEQTAGWLKADSLAFHGIPLTGSRAAEAVGAMMADERILTAVYDDGLPDHAWRGNVPVATYGTMTKTLNAGHGRLIDAHLVTSVSVRASHRRQGLLRWMMTEDLGRAASEGLALAALTASEGTIYGRFGFGPAAYIRRVHVDVGRGAIMARPPSGRVHPVEPRVLLELAPLLYARFHAAVQGSLGRPDSYRLSAAGRWRDQHPRRDKALRAALHYDDGGQPDGYVTYRFKGWDTEPKTLEVTDLVAADPSAYLGLWGYLASIDLVDRVEFPLAGPDDPLPWAMVDSRGYRVVGEEDALWLRILNVPAALEARHYAADEDLTLQVEDPLGLAGGTFRIESRGGSATVTPVAGDADVVLDVAALGSLYLNGVSPASLAAAGRIECRGPVGLEKFTALWGGMERPYCITRF